MFLFTLIFLIQIEYTSMIHITTLHLDSRSNRIHILLIAFLDS